MSIEDLRGISIAALRSELHARTLGLDLETDFTLKQIETMKFGKFLATEFLKPEPNEDAIRRAEQRYWDRIITLEKREFSHQITHT